MSRTSVVPLVTARQARAITALIRACAEHDGASPLDEAAQLALETDQEADGSWHVLRTYRNKIVGYASVLADGTIQGMVAPDRRLAGHGGALLSEALSLAAHPAVWVHGGSQHSLDFLERRGLVPERTLFVMTRDLAQGETIELASPRPAQGADARFATLDSGDFEQIDALVRVNARAFADHPEQGSLARADFDQRMAQEWFDPRDVHLAWVDGQLAAFVWIKREAGEREIYVVGTDPDFSGRSLATALLTRALADLAETGGAVSLYVDESNERAVALYRRLGFEVSAVHVQCRPRSRRPRVDQSPGISDRASDSTGRETKTPDPATEGDRPATLRANQPMPEGRFLDRELSWLDFNQRVLEMAADPRTPLLERLRYASIVSSNLDEYVMVRVAAMLAGADAGVAKTGPSGISPEALLVKVRRRIRAMQKAQSRLVNTTLLPALRDEAGVEIVRWKELDKKTKKTLRRYVRSRVLPILSPLSMDESQDVPAVRSLSLTFALTVSSAESDPRHALVSIPQSLPRFVLVDSPDERLDALDRRDLRGGAKSSSREKERVRVIALEDLIRPHLRELFDGASLSDISLFRLTRDADLPVADDEVDDIVPALERQLLRRRHGRPVRMEVDAAMSASFAKALAKRFRVRKRAIVRIKGLLDLRCLEEFSALDVPDLHHRPHAPSTHVRLADCAGPHDDPVAGDHRDIFAAMRERSVLVHFPYDSFETSVQALVEQAAVDPQVRAIKQTLYRTSGDSPVIDALVSAARAGKQVLVVVEVQARFDEANNISWAKKLEDAGAHVVFGIVGLKTHAKLLMVVREEEGGMRRYCHIGSGNFHPRTARNFEDFGLLTAKASVGRDLARLFNQVSGFAPATSFRTLVVAPRYLRPRMLELIEEQIQRAGADKRAGIRIKGNGLLDPQIIDALYRASQAGVSIDIVVRGMCALRPGVPGLSENIRVRSILGRFLEHSRLYEFQTDGQPKVYMGSPDMMPRNLDQRVEVLVPLTRKAHIRQVRRVLDLFLSEKTRSWHLDGEGEWVLHDLDAKGRPLRDAHETLMRRYERARSRT